MIRKVLSNMKNVIFRADDLGYSEGVNCGIAKAVREGVVSCVGVMANMDAAQHGIDLLVDAEAVLGMHAVMSAGAPVLPPHEVASLVDGNGLFKSSSFYRENQGKDIAFEELINEIDAQIERFYAMTNRLPAYLDFHAVFAPCFVEAVEEVGSRRGIPTCTGLSGLCMVGNASVTILPICHEETLEKQRRAVEEQLSKVTAGGISLYILHPGYVDMPLLETSSVTLPRCFDVALACDGQFREWLRKNDFEITDFASVQQF